MEWRDGLSVTCFQRLKRAVDIRYVACVLVERAVSRRFLSQKGNLRTSSLHSQTVSLQKNSIKCDFTNTTLKIQSFLR